MEDKIKLTLELTENQLEQVLKALDTTSRIYAGQWDVIMNLMHENPNNSRTINYSNENRLLSLYRNTLCPEFEVDGIRENGSYGINSEKISDNARIIYDIYKVLMYEAGAGGVYAFSPNLTSKKESLPKIDFDKKEKIEFTGDNKQEVCNFLEIDLIQYMHNNKLYIPIEDPSSVYQTCQTLKTGDIIVKKRNNKAYVISAENREK